MNNDEWYQRVRRWSDWRRKMRAAQRAKRLHARIATIGKQANNESGLWRIEEGKKRHKMMRTQLRTSCDTKRARRNLLQAARHSSEQLPRHSVHQNQNGVWSAKPQIAGSQGVMSRTSLCHDVPGWFLDCSHSVARGFQYSTRADTKCT